MEFERKSERNQRIADQRKLERELGLPHRQLTDANSAKLRILRRDRLEGVTLYTRDALRNHGKELIPYDIDCV